MGKDSRKQRSPSRLTSRGGSVAYVDNATKPYPGDPVPCLETVADIKHDDCCVTRIFVATHTGTHIDAAAHVMQGGKRLGDYPLATFSGTACVVDLRGCG